MFTITKVSVKAPPPKKSILGIMDSYSRWLKAVCQRAQPADNELTTKSQLLSSKRVIASAMLSIPVQAYERETHME